MWDACVSVTNWPQKFISLTLIFWYLGKVVGEVEDVVDEISRGRDLEVGDGPVVHDEPALLAIKLKEAIHAAVLGKLLFLRERADDSL